MMGDAKDLTKLEENPVTKLKKITFECDLCKLREEIDYKGRKPPFAREIMLKEESYIMKDPFSQPGRGQILIIGNDCYACGRTVCIGKKCSIFYTKTMCIDCAKNKIEQLPSEITNKLRQSDSIK